MFRDAITELFETELQGRFTSRARSGMMSVLNYVGGYGKYRGEGGKGGVGGVSGRKQQKHGLEKVWGIKQVYIMEILLELGVNWEMLIKVGYLPGNGSSVSPTFGEGKSSTQVGAGGDEDM